MKSIRDNPSISRTIIAIIAGGAIIQSAIAQEILTETNSNGTYTTGNRNDFPADLSKMVPGSNELPMLLDNNLFSQIKAAQTFKNNFIVDFTNIDPKSFSPENPVYNLAMQRRGMPFFYTAKALFFVLLLLMIARVMYGYLGGFVTKVRVLRTEKKIVANKVMGVGIFFFLFFGNGFITATWNSINKTDEHFTKVIVGHAIDSRKTLKDVIDTIREINAEKYPAYYSQFEHDRFHISPLLGPLMKEADSSIKQAQRMALAIEIYHSRHLKWCFFIVLCTYLIIITLRYAFKKRKKLVSLMCAFLAIGVAGFGFIANGFYFNFGTIKVEICEQTSQVIGRNHIPFYGQGIARIVTSFSTDSKDRMREQIYEFNIAINSLYIMYGNRLKRLGKESDYAEIQKGGVWTLFLNYGRNKPKDEILNNIYNLMKKFWRMYYQIESLLESRNLKEWSFTFSNKVCAVVLAWDMAAFGNLFLTMAFILVIAMGGWMNEYIILCILWEESQFLNIEKYRFDWL